MATVPTIEWERTQTLSIKSRLYARGPLHVKSGNTAAKPSRVAIQT